jgi:predicted permease
MAGATLSIMLNAFAAMTKIFLISAVGIFLAKYPAKDPMLPAIMIKYLSKLVNNVFIPCLIINSLGSAITAELLQRIGVLVLFCFVANAISYFFGYTVGRLLHGRSDDAMFIALTVAIGSPNATSLPIMVMQTMCDESYVKKDYGDNYQQCYDEANSMLFVYAMGWHLMFWSYGFPKLKAIKKRFYPDQSVSSAVVADINDGIAESQNYFLNDILTKISFRKNKIAFCDWLMTIFLTPAMIAIFIGVAIGLIPFTQIMMFKEMSFLRPLGSAITTLGEPVVAINCLVMSASLAQVDFSVGRDIKADKKVSIKGTVTELDSREMTAERRISASEILLHDEKQSRSKSISTYLFDKLPALNRHLNANDAKYSRIHSEEYSRSTNILSSTENGLSNQFSLSTTIDDSNDNIAGIQMIGANNNGSFITGTISTSDKEECFVNANHEILEELHINIISEPEELSPNSKGFESEGHKVSIEYLSPTSIEKVVSPAKIPPPTIRSIFAMIVCR